MVDIGGDDRSTGSDLVADELGFDVLAQGDILHLRRDLASPRVVHLREVRIAAPSAGIDPLGAKSRETSARVEVLWSGRVVDKDRLLSVGKLHFTDRYLEILVHALS